MALTNTTFSSDVAATDNTVLLTATTNLGPGMFLECEDEWMKVSNGFVAGTAATIPVPVQRGYDGTVAKAHVGGAVGAVVTIYVLASDIPNPAPGTAINRPQGVRPYITGLRASGAYTPQAGNQDEELVLYGTSVIAVTLTNPLMSQNGKRVTVRGNAIAAHTITYTTVGFGNVGATADVATFGANQIQSYLFEASGGFWINHGPLATATANVSGPSLA